MVAELKQTGEELRHGLVGELKDCFQGDIVGRQVRISVPGGAGAVDFLERAIYVGHLHLDLVRFRRRRW